jgi:trk system potassium uptake protein TrkH
MPALTDSPAPPRRRSGISLKPAQLIALSFASVILAGTLLLWSPAAAAGERLTLIDAFFTTVSATCVTGLVTFDVGSRLSLFGQLVVLACIQIGGLGLMTLTTLFAAMVGRRLPITDRIAILESFHHRATNKVASLIFHIVLATLLAEAVGALLLFLHWTSAGHIPQWSTRLYHAIFHSISAFCNAGFSLYSDNMIGFARDFFTQAVITGLIVTGGIGFLATLDVRNYLMQAYLPGMKRSGLLAHMEPRVRPRLTVHTKVVLTVSVLLLAVGTVSYFLLERDGLLAHMSFAEALWNAWFCAVTARTAGFNTIDYAELSGPALMCTMAMMFIGASPGSTGGGIKTTTFGILVANAIFRLRGKPRLHSFGRTIPEETIERAHAIVVSAIAVVVLAASVVIAAEAKRHGSAHSRDLFLPVLFETISAFGTVGLSMNFTPTLSTLGKLMIALVMFIGRLGPLTVAVAIASRRQQENYQYAEENLMVG